MHDQFPTIGVAGKMTVVVTAYLTNLASFLENKRKMFFFKIYPILIRLIYFFLLFSDTTKKEEDLTISKKLRERVRERGQ